MPGTGSGRSRERAPPDPLDGSTAAFAVGMLAVLAVAGAFVYLKVRSDLNEALDESLASRADDVAALGRRRRDPGSRTAERLVEGEDSFSEVLSPDGAVQASHASPGGGARHHGIRGGSAPPAGHRSCSSGRCPASTAARGSWRAESRRRTEPPWSWSGRRRQDRREALTGLTGAFAVGAPLAVVLASLIGYLLAGRALAPVEGMRRRAAGISLERRGERLPLPEADDELRRLGETLNEMLDRIEASLERERVFVADASHELRTPLAILRSELELAERPGRAPDDLRAAIRSAAEEVERLSRLAEDLLVIARADQGRLPISREGVPLDALVERVRSRFEAQVEVVRETALRPTSGPGTPPSSIHCESNRPSATSWTTR